MRTFHKQNPPDACSTPKIESLESLKEANPDDVDSNDFWGELVEGSLNYYEIFSIFM
jgi:hypothetical protein